MTAGTNEKILFKEDSKEKYIAHFLQNKIKIIHINIHLPSSYKGLGSWAVEVGFSLKREKQINAVKKLIGEIKLNPLDFDSMTIEEKTEFNLSDACPELGMHVDFCDGSFMLIYVNERLKNSLGTNMSVQYCNYTGSKNKIYNCYTASISDKEKNLIIDLANNMFDLFVKNCL